MCGHPAWASAARRGLTAVELMVVIGVISMLALLAVGPVGRSLRRATLNQAVATVETAIAETQALAIQRPRPSLDLSDPAAVVPHFGLRLEEESGRIVLRLLYGSGPDDLHPGHDGSGVRWLLPEGVQLQSVLPAGRTRLYWFFTYGRAQPVAEVAGAAGSALVPTPVGFDQAQQFWVRASSRDYNLPAQVSGVAQQLALRSSDGRHEIAIGLHPLGMLVKRDP